MKTWRRFGWMVCKRLLAAAILVLVGRQFYLNLTLLDWRELSLRPGWLLLSALLYLGGMSASGWFWYHLLHVFQQRPRALAAIRAYAVGHLGKYVPGKAWALLLRGGLIRGPGVRFGVAILTAIYEVFTTMAVGVLVAAALFALGTPAVIDLELHPVLIVLLLLTALGLLLLPAIFNRLVAWAAARFERIESFGLPRLRGATLALGLTVNTGGWLLLGASLWATVNAVVPAPQALTLERWASYTAMTALAYVAGFLAVMLPGGVGVREGILERLLAAYWSGLGPAAGIATVIVLTLRLLWTATEVIVAGLVYWLPGQTEKGVVGAMASAENGREDPRD